MSWGAVIGVVGSVVGGSIASGGSTSAANTAASADQAAIDEQRRQFDLTRGDTAPYRNIGSQAINRLGQIYGYSSGPTGQQQQPLSFDEWSRQQPAPLQTTFPSRQGQLTIPERARHPPDLQGGYQTYLQGFQQSGTPTASAATAPDYSSFYASPDYNFRRMEGQRDVGNSFAARGGAASGNALKALADYNSNLAAGEFGNFFNRQAALAGIGQTGVGQAASAGGAASSNISNLLSNQGDARASGIIGSSNAWGNALNQVGGAIGDWWQNRNKKKNPDPFGGGGW